MSATQGPRLLRRVRPRAPRGARPGLACGDLAAADLVQRTFLACCEGIARYRGDASFRSDLYSEAALTLGIPEGTAKTRIRRGRLLLEQRFRAKL